eukprot:1102555-Rhodomonas_salina.1
MQRPGFNTVCNENWGSAENIRARWGFCGNVPQQSCQPADTDDADFAIGLGINGPAAPTRLGAGYNGPFVTGYGAGQSFQAW